MTSNAGISVVIFLFALHGLAQPPSIRFDRLSLEDGLSQATVLAAVQDHDGYLWFGTTDGLNRYDGYGIKVYRDVVGDPDSLASSYISSLLVDDAGDLWVGTLYECLHRRKLDSDGFERFQPEPGKGNSLSNETINTLYEDRQGVLWVGTAAGLNQFNRETGTFIRHIHNLKEGGSPRFNQINTILEDRNGTLWVGTAMGLAVFERDSRRFIPHLYEKGNPYSLSDNRVNVLFEDQSGNLWVGTQNGLNRFERTSGRFLRYLQDLEDQKGRDVTSIWEAPNGSLWLGTRGGGLLVWDKQSRQLSRRFQRKPGRFELSDNYIHCILEDHSGVVWFGMGTSGLNRLNYHQLQFRIYTHTPGEPGSLSGDYIKSIYRDSRNTLWVGTYESGLNRLDRGSEAFKHYRHMPDKPQSLPSDRIYAITEDHRGQVWIGTNGAGLCRINLESDTFTRFPDNGSGEDPSLSRIRVSALLTDREGDIWVGTRGNGLKRFEPDTSRFHHYEAEPLKKEPSTNEGPRQLSHEWVRCLFEDRDGVLWVGTLLGLNKYDGKGGFVHYKHDPNDPNTISGNRVLAIHEGTRGYFWVGTTRGLNRMDRETGRFQRFQTDHGLANSHVYGILSTNRGDLWLSTNKGLSRFYPDTQRFRNYTIVDGLQGDEFNEGAYFRAENGEMLFGGLNGLNAFYPGSIRDHSANPKVLLTDLYLGRQTTAPVVPNGANSPLDKPLSRTPKLVLEGKRDSLFSIHFVGFHYMDPPSIRYAYRLKGIDADWVETKAGARFATYGGLTPGAYPFEVKAAYGDQDWSGDTARIDITVAGGTPAWLWWLIWVCLLVLVAGGVGVLLLRRYRAGCVNEISRTRQHIFLENALHELDAHLIGVSEMLEAQLEQIYSLLPNEARAKLTQVGNHLRRLSRMVGHHFSLVKLHQGRVQLNLGAVDLFSLVNEVFVLMEPRIGLKSLRLINDVPENLPSVVADRDRLIQIFHNLVGNGVKYTRVGAVTVRAAVNRNQVRVDVVDTGSGMEQSYCRMLRGQFNTQVSEDDWVDEDQIGMGLRITNQLVRLHGSEILLRSRRHVGTTFSFKLPISETEADAPEVAFVLNRKFSTGVQGFDAGRVKPEFQRSDTGTFRVLIVDDEPINRHVLADHLALNHYEIIEASDGEKALRILADEKSIDLILLDIMMPKISGYEVCRKIREDFPVHELPIIFLTAKNRKDDLVTGFKAGANDYLTKPVAKEELLLRVETHLRLLDITRTLEEKIAERTRELRDKNRELGLRNEELATIDGIVKTINREIVLDTVLQTIIQQGMILFPQAEKGAILLWESDYRMFKLKAAVGFDVDALKTSGYSLNELRNRYLRDSEQLENGVFLVRPGKNLVQVKRFDGVPMPKCMLAMTILVRNKLRGFLVLDNFQKDNAFDQSDARKLNRFREHAISAVGKAFLLRELHDKNNRVIRAQRRLVEQEKMASLGTLTAGMAHEINTPLGVSVTAASLLEDQVSELERRFDGEQLTRESLNAFLHNCRDSSRFVVSNLTKVSDLVRSFRQVAADQVEVARRKFNLADYIREVLRGFEMEFHQENHQVAVLGACEVELDSYPGCIFQVVVNLVRNAIQHAYPGKTGPMRFIISREGPICTLVFEDEGKGMTPEVRHKIFDPFFTTRRGEGRIGLGLHVVYNLVTNKLGGGIECKSTAGEGTRFTMSLPLKVPTA